MTEKTDFEYSGIILDHYRQEAELHGKDASSTMRDETTRGREVASVLRVLEWLATCGELPTSLVDIGCGNGYLLSVLRERHPTLELAGLEYTPDMVELARARNIRECPITQGDVRSLPFGDAAWHGAITERCVINVMDGQDQADSLREIARVLKPGGYYLCIEAFQDGLSQLNEARGELGLEPNQVPHHNLWFDEAWFRSIVDPHFQIIDLTNENDPTLPPTNFLSSHYFISRVLYPAVTRAPIRYNTHLVKFFSFLKPMGNYSPIQFWLLKRR